jgi:hypothetical protein
VKIILVNGKIYNKMFITEKYIRNLILKILKEEKEYYDWWENESSAVSNVFSQFLEDKKNNINKQKWNLIPFEQYKNALIEFMKYGKFMRFPTKYIYDWEKIIINNTMQLYANTVLSGHDSYFPYNEVLEILGFEEDSDEYNKLNNNYEEMTNYLDKLGFYDYSIAPDGSDAISDYGLKPIFKLLNELEDAKTPEEKIVLINRILDVIHQRGDMASMFIEGGRNSLDKISNE